MAEEVVDHEARRQAGMALQRLDDHIKVADQRYDSQEKRMAVFDKDLKDGLSGITTSIGRVHQRIDGIGKMVMVLLGTALLGLIGSVLYFIADKVLK